MIQMFSEGIPFRQKLVDSNHHFDNPNDDFLYSFPSANDLPKVKTRMDFLRPNQQRNGLDHLLF